MNRRMSPDNVRLLWSVMKLRQTAEANWWKGLKAGLTLSLVPMVLMFALTVDESEVIHHREAAVDTILVAADRVLAFFG